MIEFVKVDNLVRCAVKLQLKGLPDMPVDFTKKLFEPTTVDIEFKYQQTSSGDGWTEHTWIVAQVVVTGPRVLKPADDGSRRTSKLDGCARFYGSKALAALPEFLADLIREVQPHGSVDLVGDVL